MGKKPKPKQKKQNLLVKWILIIAGTVSLGLGIIGIFLPILPTTPFLLLAAACYARSSKKFYDWLLQNKWVGAYVKNYREGNGIPIIIKAFTIALLWVTILFSIFYIVSFYWVKIGLLIIALGVTVHIVTIKTYGRKRS